jgi:predicted Zn-dependent protease
MAALALFVNPLRDLGAGNELEPCKNKYAPQQQVELGDKAKAGVYKQMPVLPDSSPATQYVQRLGNKLTANAPGYRWPYNFH